MPTEREIEAAAKAMWETGPHHPNWRWEDCHQYFDQSRWRNKAKVALEAAERVRGDGWRPVSDKPLPGSKIVALYNDGSGSRMLFVHDAGFIDSDGDEISDLNGYDRWTYLPDGFEFWCETRAEDPVTFIPAPPADQEEGK